MKNIKYWLIFIASVALLVTTGTLSIIDAVRIKKAVKSYELEKNKIIAQTDGAKAEYKDLIKANEKLIEKNSVLEQKNIAMEETIKITQKRLDALGKEYPDVTDGKDGIIIEGSYYMWADTPNEAYDKMISICENTISTPETLVKKVVLSLEETNSIKNSVTSVMIATNKPYFFRETIFTKDSGNYYGFQLIYMDFVSGKVYADTWGRKQ